MSASFPAPPSLPHASSTQIHVLAGPPRLGGAAHAPALCVPVVPRDATPYGSVSPATLQATRARRWTEQVVRIRDDATSWILCVQEWKRADREAEAESGPVTREWQARRSEMYSYRADQELLNLARWIYFEGTREEKRGMPHSTASLAAFVDWARMEAKSGDPRRRARCGV